MAAVDETALQQIPLRRHRTYQSLFLAQASTDFCEQFLIIAITWAALHQFGSGKLALVLAAWAIPRGVLLLLGGVLVDRLDRKRLMTSVSLALAVLTVGAALMTRSGNLAVWISVAIGLGILDAVRLPVTASVMPMVVHPDQLVDANRWTGMREWAALAGGPALGGVLVAVFGTYGTLIVSAVLYLVSAALMVLVPSLPPTTTTPGSSLRADLTSGLRYVTQHPQLRILLLGFGLANLFVLGLLGVIIPVYAKDILHAGPQGLGALSASFGVGLVVGTLLCTRLPLAWQKSQRHIFLMFAVSDGLLAAVGLARLLPLACIIFFASGIAAGPASTFYRTLMQTLPPTEYLGRVNSIARAASFGLEPVSVIGMGALSSRVSSSLLLVVGGIAATGVDIAGSLLNRTKRVKASEAAEGNRRRHR